jgi:hypothetical protein
MIMAIPLIPAFEIPRIRAAQPARTQLAIGIFKERV